MKSILFTGALLSMVASGVQAQESPPVQPTLKTAPPAGAMLKLFPQAAMNARIGGDVVIACGWTDEGRLKDCRVLKEAPVGYGFAEATIKGFEKHARLKDMTAESAPGEEKKFRYKWTIQ